MALTPDEQQEYEQLKKELGTQALSQFGYSPNEAADISVEHRAKAKLFAANPEQQLSYIKKNYPDLDVVLNQGEVYAKKRGVNEPYKAMDPEFSPWSSFSSTVKDLPQDVLESLYDVGGGAVQGAATTIGALPGVLSFNPLLAAGGAVGASAASGAGVEGFRQMLGKALGVNEEYDPGQIGMATAVGAVSPAVGAAASKGLQAAGKGLKWLGAGMTKFTPEEVSTYLEQMPAVNRIKDLLTSRQEHVLNKEAADTISGVRGTLAKAGMNVDKELKEILENKRVGVNLEQIKAKAASIINNLPEDEANQFKAIIGDLENTLSGYKAAEKAIPPAQGDLFGGMIKGEENILMSEPEKKVVSSKLVPDETLLDVEKISRKTPAQMERELEWYMQNKEFMDKLPPEARKKLEESGMLQQFMDEYPISQKTPAEIDESLKKYYDQVSKYTAAQEDVARKNLGSELAGGYQMEAFPFETPVTKGVSEADQLLALGPMSSSSVSAEANQARRLKQLLQSAAKYGKTESLASGKSGAAASKDIARLADKLGAQLKEIDGVASRDNLMRAGITIQKLLEKKEKAPLTFLSSMNDDTRALISAAAEKTGDKRLIDLANQLSVAKKILKTAPEAITKEQFLPATGRGLIRMGQKMATEKAPSKISKSGAASALWEEIMKEINKQGDTSL